jgi:hypothetical protein
MRSVVFALLVAASLSAGCSGSSTTTPSTVVSGTLTEVFAGSVDVNGAAFYSFTVTTNGTATVMLASVTTATPGPAADIGMSLGIGVPAGTGCPVTTSVTVGPALTSQIATTLAPGIYCVNIADAGNLRAPVNFAIRIVHT